MKTRLMTSILIVAVLAIAFVLKQTVSPYFFDALILFITIMSAYEMSKLLTKMDKPNNQILATIFPAFLMLSILLNTAFDSSLGVIYGIVIEVALIVIFFAIAFVWPLITKGKTTKEIRYKRLQISNTKYAFQKAMNTAFTYVYPSFLLMFMGYINHFDELTTSFANVGEFGGYFSLVALLFAFLIPIFTDTFAYLVGGIFGGKKLCPKISPNKTISGAVGGLLACVLFSTALYFIFFSIPELRTIFAVNNFEFWHVIIISFIGSALAQAGDILESLFKRQASVKDSGRFLPGHGGMLDRCDSYMFVMPYIFLAFSIFILVA